MAKNLIIIALVTLNLAFGWSLIETQLSTPKTPVQTVDIAEPTAAPKAVVSIAEPVAIQANGNTAELMAFAINGDYSGMADELRSAGYDEDLVRQIMLATIERDKLLNQRGQTARAYWHKNDQPPEDSVSEELAWLAKKRQMLRDLFGDQIENDPLFESLFKPMQASLPFLDSGKQVAIFELQERNDAKTRALFQSGYTQEARAERRELREQLQAQVAEILTTDQLFEYQLRESRLAERMLRTSAAFNYTENEYRDIYRIRQQNEGAQLENYVDRRSFEQTREFSNQQIRDYLGETRYEEYQRAEDPAYRSLASIGERYGNTDDEVLTVYQLTQEAKREMEAVRNLEGVTRSERREKVQAVREASLQAIENVAGTETAESVRKNAHQVGLGRGG